MQEQLDEIQQLLAVNNPKNSGSLRIESDILEPQQVSQRYATFNLRKAGILSNDSRLLMKVYASNSTTALTAYGGVFGLIKNATLRCSDGTVIAQTVDANYMASIRNHFVSQEVRRKRGLIVNGCWNNYKYGTQETGGTTYTGKLQIMDLVGEGGTLVQQQRFRLSTSASGAQEYTVSLKDLFPELFPFSIPLYLLEGQLQLFIEFNDDYKGVKSVATDGNNANIGDVLIDTANLKFVSDHVFMGSDGMQKLAQLTMGEKGLTIPYADYTTLQFTRTAPSAPNAGSVKGETYQNTFSLAGVRCKHMLIHNSEATADPNDRQKLTGNYASLDSYGGLKGASLQLQINNENYFSQPLQNQEFYKELEDVFGTAMSTPYPVYTTIGSVIDSLDKTANMQGDEYSIGDEGEKRCLLSSDTVFGIDAQKALLGTANVIGVNFTHNRVNNGMNGLEIGNAPIQMTYTRDFTNDTATNMSTRVFVCCERLMNIKNGKVFNNFS